MTVDKSAINKRKIDKLEFIKILHVYSEKDTVRKRKDKPQTGEKISVNYVSNKGLVCRLWKAFSKFNIKKSNRSSRK